MDLVKNSGLRRLFLVAAFFSPAPASAIVVSGSDPNSAVISFGQTINQMSLSGVVEVTSSDGGCSGALLADGLSILTAGHCVTKGYGLPTATDITVSFLGPAGMVDYTVSSVFVNPGYTGDSTKGGDLAVLRLSSNAPAFATGYQLYNGLMPAGPEVIAGYGTTGTGLTGANGGFGTLRAGQNEYVVTGGLFGWSDSLYVGQFYQSGVPTTNALGNFDPTPYQASDEVDIAHGDSGGPSFYNGYLIGVHDLGICMGTGDACATPPSLNSANNSYFGELYADVSVTSNLDWIQTQETPEPGTMLLLTGALCAAAWRRRAGSIRQRGMIAPKDETTPVHRPAGGPAQ